LTCPHKLSMSPEPTLPRRYRFVFRLLKVILLPVLACLAAPAAAQDYPLPSDPFVNDTAGVLDPADSSGLRETLARLKAETGVEATILTLPQRPDAGRPLEDYASGLFNAWGIGDATRNDGILILVVPGGREMRVQLGSGYDQDDDLMAQDIISRVFLPRFRDGAYSAGIVEGTAQVVDRIARAHAAGLPPATAAERQGIGNFIFPIALAGLSVIVLFRRRIGGWAFSLKRCPQCGSRGLHRHEESAQGAAGEAGSAPATVRRLVTRCPNCDWQERRDVPFRSAAGRRSGGSFGGGRSSGGGASGRW